MIPYPRGAYIPEELDEFKSLEDERVTMHCRGTCQTSEITDALGLPTLAYSGYSSDSFDAYWVQSPWAEAEIREVLTGELQPLKMAAVLEGKIIS